MNSLNAITPESIEENSYVHAEQEFGEFEEAQYKQSVLMWSSVALFFGFLFGVASLLFPHFFSDEHSYTMSHKDSHNTESGGPHSANILENTTPAYAPQELIIKATYN